MANGNKKNIGEGLPCRKCGGKTQTRKGTNHGKQWYFSQYDYCRFCNAVYFDEKYKICVSNRMQSVVKNRVENRTKRPTQNIPTKKGLRESKKKYWEWKDELNQVIERINHTA